MNQLKAIEAFIAVAKHQSFSGAARHLQISNASVTRHINDLETYLGVSLFVRTTRALNLTETGASYLSNVQTVLPQLESANDIAKGERVKPRGVLKVTAPTMFGQLHVTPVIAKYLDTYPDVEVEATFLDRRVSMVEEGYDVAIRIGHLPDSSMRAVKLRDVQWTVCASPRYWSENPEVKRPEDLLQHKIIAFVNDSNKPIWHFINGQQVDLESRLKLTSVAASIDCALSSWGVVRALSYQVEEHINSGALVRVLHDFEQPSVPVHLLHNDHSLNSAKIRSFKEMMVKAQRQSVS